MTGTAIVTQIIEILVSGITGIATGVGKGMSDLVSNLFFTAEGTAMSTFGTLVVVFAGIGLAIGLSRLVVGWLSSLGGSTMR